MSELKDRIVKHEIIERITIVGPSEESKEAYQWLGSGDYRIVASGPYQDREMWPEVDVCRYKIMAERPAEVGPKIRNSIQPLYVDDHGTIRFKRNEIVRLLLDEGPFDMNKLALMDFTDNDREQFAQLIGYSLSGFGELSYVSDRTYDEADEMKPQLTAEKIYDSRGKS